MAKKKLRTSFRQFTETLRRLFTGCSSAPVPTVQDGDIEREIPEVALPTPPLVQDQDAEREMSVIQRASLIVQDMIQRDLSFSDFDTYMESFHGEMVATFPTASHSMPAPSASRPFIAPAPRATPVSPCGVPAPAPACEAGRAIPAHIQAALARLEATRPFVQAITEGGMGLPARRDMPVFELPKAPIGSVVMTSRRDLPAFGMAAVSAPLKAVQASSSSSAPTAGAQPKSVAAHLLPTPPPSQPSQDLDDFIETFNASMVPAASKPAVMPAQAALPRLKPTQEMDALMERFLGGTEVPICTGLPLLKLPIALGSSSSRTGQFPSGTDQSSGSLVLRNSRAVAAPFEAYRSTPAVPVPPKSVAPLESVQGTILPERWDIPVFMPGGASSSILPARSTISAAPSSRVAPSAVQAAAFSTNQEVRFCFSASPGDSTPSDVMLALGLVPARLLRPLPAV